MTDKIPKKIKYFNKIVNANKTLSIIDGSKLEVEISYEDSHFIAFNKRFGIYGFGESEDEAIDDFNNSFIIYFEGIVNTPENSLGQSTLEFKKVLLAFAIFDTLRTNARPVNPRIRKSKMHEEIDDGSWICETCHNACAADWSYCPYCGDPGPDEE